LRQVIEKYPKSVYTPSSCWDLVSIYEVFKGDLTNANVYKKKLLFDYPNSGYCQNALGFLQDKSQKEKVQTLKELETKYANTRLGKFIRNLRNKVFAY
jgi:outer membrane protein assembly factor BamD (BamD/ComL family)